ncbi:MAG: FAD-dependent oxidoreductase [Candidatus Atabeyarchaeum deiterrae]
MFDAIVVGGGIGGLATGALLTKKGFKVLLLEQAGILGGRANSIDYKKQYIVDWGIHLLRFGDKGIAAQVFNALGERLEVVEPGEGRLFHEGQWFELPTKADVLRRTPLLTDEDKKAVGGLLVKIIGTAPEKTLGLSIAEWLEDMGVSKRLEWIMKLISKLCITTHSPSDLSCGEVFTVISGALKTGKSVGYPRGGWKSIVERLASLILEGGGELKTNMRVEKITIDGRMRARGIIAGSSRIEADNIVYAGTCQQLHNLVDEGDVGGAFLARATAIMPTAGVSIDLGIRGKASDLNGMVAIYEPFILGQFTSNIDPSVAPSGQQLATFLSVLSPDEVRKKTKVEQAFEVLESYVLKMFPRIKGSILWKRKTTMDIVDGVLPSTLQSREKRIGFMGPVKGLYFAGDCYDGEGGGSDIAFHSARRCAEVIGNK